MKKTAESIKALLDIQVDARGISIILQMPAI
jgi:hypothetical protein